MDLHLQRELDKVKGRLLEISRNITENVRQAVESLASRDKWLAQQVIASDVSIDDAEVDLEEDCLKILALYHPANDDLRLVVAVLKINAMLERIGDLAVNIAERSVFLVDAAEIELPADLPLMTRKVQDMLQDSLTSLLNTDTDLARQVCARDDEVDDLNRELFGWVERGIRETPEHTDALIHILLVARHLERIADMATSISTVVVYMAEGEIIRHQTEHFHRGGGAGGAAPAAEG
ncbi:MAG: phosphate signaling complex protein PhoU [Kiritimatiellae bacterium]|nr:phosphate signaling complex protein PhoU [Kiritimatiellia bacterium]